MKIFWSWQNDSDPKTNRNFIRDALVKAIEAVADTLDLEDADRPELDHDTKNAPGMADITGTILDKISESAVFVADLTPIGKTRDGKALPNPNVLIELGWALRELGAERIIAILNTAVAAPDDLPFDIRHRRALTYELVSGAEKDIRRTVLKRLTTDLAQAMTTNLQQYAEDQATASEIVCIPAKAGDPSIWASCNGRLDYIDTSNQNRTVIVPDGPRGYIRIIPSGWKDDIPPVASIMNANQGEEVFPAGEGSPSGDFGPCEQGFTRIWFTAGREARNVSMWFDETGEFWVIHGTAISVWKNGKSMLVIGNLLLRWRENLHSAMKVLNRFEAYRTIKVEAGLVGIRNVMWPADMTSGSNPARKDQTIIRQQQKDWSDEAQIAFLSDVYNEIRDNFSLSPTAPSDLKMILQEK